MHTALSLDDTADGPNLQRKSRILEWLLHLAATEPAQVAVVGVRGTVRVRVSKRSKLPCARPDLCLVSLQDLDGFLLGACDIRLSTTQVSIQDKMLPCERGDDDENEDELASFQLDGRREPLCLTKR